MLSASRPVSFGHIRCGGGTLLVLRPLGNRGRLGARRFGGAASEHTARLPYHRTFRITAEPAQGPAGMQVIVRGREWPPGDLIKLFGTFLYLILWCLIICYDPWKMSPYFSRTCQNIRSAQEDLLGALQWAYFHGHPTLGSASSRGKSES
jgi:hypothetical protein